MNNNDHNVSIALCTYNGAAYINEQLNSLAEQTLTPTELVVFDDGSTDSTVAKVTRFKQTAKFPVLITENPCRLGVSKNFECAIRKCSGDIIALCDQDDIWEKTKLEDTVHALMQGINHDTAIPALAHTGNRMLFNDGSVQDNPCRYKGERVPLMSSLLKRLVLQNTVTGCTAVFTRGLKDISIPFPKNIIMHDWWLALNAAACGEIFYLHKLTVFYRRHANTITSSSKNNGVLNRIKKEIRGSISLLKCIYGHKMFESEISQAESLFLRDNKGTIRMKEAREALQRIKHGGLIEALRYVIENDIFRSHKYLKAKAAISIWRYFRQQHTHVDR